MSITKQSENDLIEGVLRHGPKIIERCLADPNDIFSYLQRINQEHLRYPVPKDQLDTSRWYIPTEYEEMDIEGYLISQCPKENYERLIQEISLYKQHNMLMVLKTMKYVMDTLRSQGIVWGVGRGSSVASYALYLLGVHKIDSVKYSLPIEEFFKGDQNG
jgi:DNA polymerase III alpha subunit